MFPLLKGMTKGQVRKGRKNNYVMPVAALVMLFMIGQALWLDKNKFMFAPFAINRIQCDHCAKVGVVRDPNDNSLMSMCPACFGVGFHSVRRFDDMDAICAACGGMGRTDIGGPWRQCERCEGRGVFRLEPWQTVVALEEISTTNAPPPVEPRP